MSLFTGTASGLYAVVDIETTGGLVTRDRITEVAICVFDGQHIVDKFESLVNPEGAIPLQIVQLTGISQEMVRNAPKFYEIAKKIVEITDGHIFVAHNVSFDYSFIKAEFARLGYTFQRKRLCTVRMSRRIIPGHASYSLGNLCRDLGIGNKARHRAAGDAIATVSLLRLLLEKDENLEIECALKSDSREALLPPNLSQKIYNGLPAATGVYYMHDSSGKVIYVGKALNIKQRMASHFGVRLDSRKALSLKGRVHDITYEETGSELVALLLESHQIKTLRPVFNTQQKRSKSNFGLFKTSTENGYDALYMDRLNAGLLPLATFSSIPQGKRFLEGIVEKYSLCQKLCDLYPTHGSCFHHQIRRCMGACIGKEAPETYNFRVAKALSGLNLGARNLAIIDRGRTAAERSLVWVENGRYVGFGYLDAEQPVENFAGLRDHITPLPDNHDVQRILNQYLRTGRPLKVVEF